MSADTVAVVVAAAVAGAAAVTSLVCVVVLRRTLRELDDIVDHLRVETVPLVREARVVVEEAATEMVRVGDVLESAESVSATVDSASRLAYRAFANPVVKIIAFGTGVTTALRRLFGGGDRESAPVRPGRSRRGRAEGTTTPSAVPSSRRHRRRSRVPQPGAAVIRVRQ
jgi:hypothetical protein